MNWADYVILGVLGISVLIGLWRGFVSEVLSLVIWIGGFWVAWTFGPQVAALFEHAIHTPALRLVAGYAVCLVGVLIVGALIKAIINRMLISSGLSGPDRMLGLLFGLGRGILLVALMVFLLGLTGIPREPWWRNSMLLPQFQGVAVALSHQLPASTAQYLRPSPEVMNQLPKMPDMKNMPDKLPSMQKLLDAPGRGGGTLPSLNDLRSVLHGAPPAPTSAPASPSTAPVAVP